MRQVTPSQLRNILSDVAFKGGLPVMIWGAPGIGKSQIVKQVAREMRMEVLDLRLNYYEESDLLGIPVKTEKGMEFIKYAQLPTAGDGVWFLDELTHARSSMQGLVFQLIQDNAIESYEVPEGWKHFVAASNLASHRSISNPMPSGLYSRFTGGHYELVPDLEDWVAWAVAEKVDEKVVSFVSYMQRMDQKPWLFRIEGSTPIMTPRTWAQGINYAVRNLHGQTRNDAIMGMIGEENGTELIQFLEASADMPDLSRILNGDLGWFSRTHEPSRYYLLVSSLAKEALDHPENLDSVLRTSLMLQDEYIAQVLSIVSRTVDRNLLKNSRFLKNNVNRFNEVLGGADARF